MEKGCVKQSYMWEGAGQERVKGAGEVEVIGSRHSRGLLV